MHSRQGEIHVSGLALLGLARRRLAHNGDAARYGIVRQLAGEFGGLERGR